MSASDHTQAATHASAKAIEAQLVTLVRHENQNRVAIALLLLEVEDKKLYEQLDNSTSTTMYARRRFDYSPRKTRELLELARNLRTQPLIRASAVAGDVSWKKAHLASRGAVMEPEKEALWRQRMLTETSRDLSIMVAETKGEEPMIRFTITLSRSEHALCEQALLDLQVTAAVDKPLTRREAFMAMIRRATAPGEGQNEAGTTILLASCEHCQKTWVDTEDGRTELDRETARLLGCDCVIKKRDGSLTRTIPAPVKRAVLVRDGGICRVPGCRHRGWLQNHHEGGWLAVGHDPQRIYLTCHGHHTQLHRGVLRAVFEGTWLQFIGADGKEIGTRLDMRVPKLATSRRRRASQPDEGAGGAGSGGGAGLESESTSAVASYSNSSA